MNTLSTSGNILPKKLKFQDTDKSDQEEESDSNYQDVVIISDTEYVVVDSSTECESDFLEWPESPYDFELDRENAEYLINRWPSPIITPEDEWSDHFISPIKKI